MILEETFETSFRVLNNHPDVFTKEKRPIVEFAVENAKAIKLLAGRRENIQKKKKLQEQMGSGMGVFIGQINASYFDSYNLVPVI